MAPAMYQHAVTLMAKHFNSSKQNVMGLRRDICSCSIIFIVNGRVFESLPFPAHTWKRGELLPRGGRAGGWQGQPRGGCCWQGFAAEIMVPWVLS